MVKGNRCFRLALTLASGGEILISLFDLLNPGVASLDRVRLAAYFELATIGKLEPRYEW